MKRILKIVLVMAAGVVAVGIGLYVMGQVKERRLLAQCKQIYANEIIKLPDKEKEGIGFTCTGLFWDETERTFLIGNAGKYKPSESVFQASVEKLSEDFKTIKESLPCYLSFDAMRDIQGVTMDSDQTIWICSYGENLVRHIDAEGRSLGEFAIREPSGIAYDKRDNTLWILTNHYLYHCSTEGKIEKQIRVHIKGQDQLFLDSEANRLYFSAGLDYHGDSYIYSVDLSADEIKPLYVLKDSYAIEGIAIKDGVLYVLNDGYYHEAEIPENQVNLYQLDNLKTEEHIGE